MLYRAETSKDMMHGMANRATKRPVSFVHAENLLKKIKSMTVLPCRSGSASQVSYGHAVVVRRIITQISGSGVYENQELFSASKKAICINFIL